MKKETGLESVIGKLPVLVLVLCVAQPILDVAGYWQNYFGISNAATLVIRMLLLTGSVLLGFLLSDRKRYYYATACVLGLLTVFHVLACMQSPNGYLAPVTDLVNLVRIYYLPLMTISMITFLRKNDGVFPAMQKAMAIVVFIIALVQLLSTLTGTDPHTYSNHGVGVLGWFMWTNSQSAILAILSPIAICWSLYRWPGKLLPVALVTAVSEATLYVLAPRLAYGSLIVSGLGFAVCILISNRGNWKQALAIGLVTCLFIASYPWSPTNQRVAFYNRKVENTQEMIKDLDIHVNQTAEKPSETDEKTDEDAASKTEEILDEANADKLEKLYRSQDMLWSVVDRFGRDRVFEAYHYSIDPNVISQARTMKITFCQLLMEDSGPLSRLFGLNLKEMTYQRYDKDGILVTDNFDVENDFHGVYFLTGAVGLILMIVFLLWFGVGALLAVIRRPKVYFTPAMAAFAIAYCLGLIHAYFTASILRRNNASIYLAMVLAGLWYLAKRKEETERA